MKPALILLGVLFAAGLLLWLLDRRGRPRDAEGNVLPEDVNEPEAVCSDDCCSTHAVCPSEQLLKAEMKCEVTYFDDEELDRFAGRGAGEYTEADIDEFRDVLYTLLPADRIGWERSLKRRGIVLPAAIRDELVMLLSEKS